MNSPTAVLILLWHFLLLSLLLHPLHSLPIQQLHAPIGRPFTFSTAEGHAVDAEMLPPWCRFNASARLIYGIPQLHDFGLHVISIHDTHIEVEVYEEEEEEAENNCGTESSTTWLEVMDARQLNGLSIEEQFQTVKDLLGSLQKDSGVRLGDVRVFPRSYLARYRTVMETIHELDDDDEEEEKSKGNARADGQIVFVLNISCGELTEEATDIINSVAENGMAFQVVEGKLRKDRSPLSTTTTTTTTISTTTGASRRTTRRVQNNRPIVLNPLSQFTCSRGLLCRLQIDENTFMDPEDGQTSRLALSVHSIGNHTNFLTVVPGTLLLEGVPLAENGAGKTFNFRLEARDRENAANSAPFQVLVNPLPEGKPNHRYSIILDTPLERFHSTPELLRDFVYRLSGALRRLPSSDPEAAGEIQIEELLDIGAGQTLVKWWNGTLNWAYCDEQRINGTRDRMAHQGTERLRHEFVKQMGAQFHVRKVSHELLGKCLTRHLLDTARIRVYTTTQRNVLSGREEEEEFGLWTNPLLIPLILLITILLLIIVLTLLCCAHHKRGKKGKRNEFTTKGGRPVVFPDEVPHRDESSSADGSLATVTTPMLVEREQPPLDPTKMTMHENPLYRPPPQVQAQLIRRPAEGGGGGGQQELSPLSRGMGGSNISPTGRHQLYGQQQQQQSPPMMSSTFNPSGHQIKPIDASPTPLRSNPFQREHPHQQSVRIHATPVGQRLPPPYLAH